MEILLAEVATPQDEVTKAVAGSASWFLRQIVFRYLVSHGEPVQAALRLISDPDLLTENMVFRVQDVWLVDS